MSKNKQATEPAEKVEMEFVRLFQMPNAVGSGPAIAVKGDVPAAGETITFTANNSVVYTGVVDEVVDVDGETVVTFADGLTHIKGD